MKRLLKVTDAVHVGGRLIATLAENDHDRGFAAGETIKTSVVIDIQGNVYETRNTRYEVDGGVLVPSDRS